MPQAVPIATIDWRFLESNDEDSRMSRCLYALVRQDKGEILYLGKAWAATIGERLRCRSKDAIWEYLSSREIDACLVQIGEVIVTPGARLTAEMLSDIESLLIFHEQPPANVQSRYSRIARPGLLISCVGEWRGESELYLDGMRRSAVT